MADDSISLQRQQKEIEILKTTEQFSKKFKNVVSNLQEVNTPLAKTIADLRETTKGSFKAAANAKELQNYTDKVVKATSDNVDKTTKSYQRLSQGLDNLSGTSGFLDQLKLAQDNYSLNQLKAIQLEQEIADAETKNRKEIQDYRDKIAKLELDRIRAEGLGQEENLKKITAEKEKQEKALTKFETEIFDTKREEYEIQKNLLDTSKSNLEKLNETVDKQAREIAEQDTKFTMFGQGLKELTGFDLLGTLDTVVDKVDAVGKIFGNKDLSGTIANAFSFGGDDTIAAIAGESQEVDPKLKIAKKELKETENIASESKETNRLLKLFLFGQTGLKSIMGGGDDNSKRTNIIAPGGLQAIKDIANKALTFIPGGVAAKTLIKKLFSGSGGSKFSQFGNSIKGTLPKTRGGKIGLLAAIATGTGLAFSGRSRGDESIEESGLMGSEASALTRGLDTYQNSKISETFRPDEIAGEGFDTYSLRGSMGEYFKNFDAEDPRKVDKLFNKDGTLDKRTKFYKEWKATQLQFHHHRSKEYQKMMKINPQELDDMIDGVKNDPFMRRYEAAKVFDKNFTKSVTAKIPMLGSGLDVFFDQRTQSKYGDNIDMLESQGLLSGEDLKTVEGAERANTRGSFGRGIGSWAGGLAGAALPALGAVALGSNPVGWGMLALGMLGGLGGAMLGGKAGDMAATFDGGAQDLTAELSAISQMNVSDEEKESMIFDALKKYKGYTSDMPSTEIVLKNATEDVRNASIEREKMNTNIINNQQVIDNSSITNVGGNALFRNPDDTARLVDVKYS